MLVTTPVLKRTPNTIEEAAEMLDEWVGPNEISYIRGPSRPIRQLVGETHSGFARDVRNGWKLWDRNQPLVKHCRERFKVTHADDISGLVMSAFFGRVRGEKVDLETIAEDYRENWSAWNKAANDER